MKLTLSWLREHLDTQASVDEITETLTDLGLEVEEVVNPADQLGAFTIARVIEAKQHPNADRLSLCRVEAFTNGQHEAPEEIQVVCGAPNAKTGMVGVFAPVGTHIPGTGIDLKPGNIRGEASNGMLCSEREMMLSDDHEGIIELPADTHLGGRFIDWLEANDPSKVDPVIEIAITPNRQDALGVEGIARDLAARGIGTKIDRPIAPVKGSFESPIKISIDDDTLDGAPYFAGRVIRGVKNGPSPEWLQHRLKAIGLRPISTLVDITNFFTYDRNRPLHVFDADKVEGDLRVYRAEGGEEIAALDDKSYTFQAGMMIIGDDRAAESIAGVMGGEETGVTEETVNVFLESAYWDPVTVARTGRELKINSDAKYRFERGVDPEFTLPGLELATAMVLELCGGEASEAVTAGAVPDATRSYRLDTDRCSSLVGMDIPAETQRQTLENLGFVLDEATTTQMVNQGAVDKWYRPPSWRPDIMGEADLVEEVARIASLTKLEPKPMPRMQTGVPKPILTSLQRREQAARRTAAALGYNECVTYSFIDEKSAQLFGGGSDAARVANPISSEMTHMRPMLLPGLLQAAARNQARGLSDLALFEVGQAFHGGEPDEEHLLVTGILIGRTSPKDVHGASRPVDVYDARADAEAVLSAIGARSKAQIMRGASDWWHPGRSGLICLGPKKVLAVFGEVNPRVLNAMDVRGPAVGFTIWPAEVPLPRQTSSTRSALAISDLQAVERDYAFVLDADVEAVNVVNAALGADKALIEDVRVFDEFIGGALGDGKKSLAITVRMQPTEKTLTDEEIEAVSVKVVEKVGKATGGVLRG